MKTESIIDIEPNIAIAEEILEMLFSHGRINRIEIQCILTKFPGHSYKLPDNQTLFKNKNTNNENI